MKFVRASRLAAFELIADRLKPTVDLSAQKVREIAETMMESRPQDLCVFLCIDVQEVLGFVIAYATGGCVMLVQIEGSDEVQDGLFTRMVSWTEERGLNEIRVETQEPELIQKEWGFVPHSVTMKLDTNILPKLLAYRCTFKDTVNLAVVSSEEQKTSKSETI